MLALADTPLVVHDVTGLGPAAALASLKERLPQAIDDRLRWRKEAKIAAILGSCPRARDSFRSGLRNWISFSEIALGSSQNGFPPPLDALLEWSHNFRCVGTYSNYLGYLRAACLALDLEMPRADHPAIQRAKTSIVKRMLFRSRCLYARSPFGISVHVFLGCGRPRMFIQRSMVRNLVLASGGWRMSHSRCCGSYRTSFYCGCLRKPYQ